MSLQYTYEITGVDEKARCMEIKYQRAGLPAVHVGARLPFDGESLQDVIRMFAPEIFWQDCARNVSIPSIGASGAVEDVAPKTLETTDEKTYALYLDYAADELAASAFLLSKGFGSNVHYITSMYNVTTKEILANLFRCGSYMVKVLNGAAKEWYEANAEINGIVYAYVSRDLVTGELLDKYRFDQRGLVKVTQDATVEPTITNFGTFASVPPLLKPFVESFEHYDRIRAWSLKPYGLVVEYSRL